MYITVGSLQLERKYSTNVVSLIYQESPFSSLSMFSDWAAKVLESSLLRESLSSRDRLGMWVTLGVMLFPVTKPRDKCNMFNFVLLLHTYDSQQWVPFETWVIQKYWTWIFWANFIFILISMVTAPKNFKGWF